MSKNRILTGHVARVVNGIPVILGPGDVAPSWVTNPALLAEAPAKTKQAPKNDTETVSSTGDELDNLTGKELSALADEVGVAKTGAKREIADRIRAKRAAGAAETGNDDTSDRASLILKVQALGIEDADDLTDAELLSVLEEQE